MIFEKFSWQCMNSNVAAVSEQPCLGVSRVILQLEILRTKLLLGAQIWNIPLQISQLLLMMTHLLLLRPSTNWFLNSWQATSIDPPEVGTYMHTWFGKNQNLDLFSKLKRLLLEPGSSLMSDRWILVVMIYNVRVYLISGIHVYQTVARARACWDLSFWWHCTSRDRSSVQHCSDDGRHLAHYMMS